MRIFLISLLLVSSFYAKEFSTRYHVNVGMFGQVGYSDFTLKATGETYEATTSAVMTGVAATLTRNWVETFTSKGKIVEGRYIPLSFVKTKSRTGKKRVQNYYFDHEKKEIRLIEVKTKTVSHSKFDTAKFKICYEDVNETSRKESTLDYYVPDDALSSYINTKMYCNSENKTHNIRAIGAHNDENNVTLSYLVGKEKNLAKLNFSPKIKDIYNIHVVPFDKDDEIVDVQVAYADDDYMQEAIMGEIFWIGKITANRVDSNTTKK